MKKEITLIFFISAIITSTVFGLTPIGPPRSVMQEGQSAFSIEYFNNEMDLQADGSATETTLPPAPSQTFYFSKEYKIENLQTDMFMTRFDSGIWENWDVFLRLGVSGAEGDITEKTASGASGDKYKDFDGSLGFAWGFGSRVTFYEEDDITWGGLFQVTWASPGDSGIIDKNDTNFSGNAEIKYWEVQLAAGPTLELENVRLYGGPFLHFVNGDLDISGTTVDTSTIPPITRAVEASHDINEESQLGGFAGAQWYLGNNTSMYGELQFTGDAWGIGLGTTWKF